MTKQPNPVDVAFLRGVFAGQIEAKDREIEWLKATLDLERTKNHAAFIKSITGSRALSDAARANADALAAELAANSLADALHSVLSNFPTSPPTISAEAKFNLEKWRTKCPE